MCCFEFQRLCCIAAFVGGVGVVAPALADESPKNGFGAAVGTEILAGNRAGDDAVDNSFNDNLESNTEQLINGSSSSNTITADSANGGTLSIAGSALQNARGMTNLTANSAPNSVVQGTMSLTVIMNQ